MNEIQPLQIDTAGADDGDVITFIGGIAAWSAPTGGGGSTAWASVTGKPDAVTSIGALTPAADRGVYYTGASSAALFTLTSFARTILDDADAATARATLGAARGDGGYPVECLIIALGDESTAITTGTAKVTFRMPYAFTVSAVRASLTTASSSGIPTFDINEGGASILSTKLTIDASEKTSTTAATAAVLSDASLADDAEMTVDVDTAGTGAAGAKIYIIGRRA